MSTNEWITDRRPTEADADTYGYVWVTEDNGLVIHMMWDCATDQPWMHFTRPKPYVKPKRYEVRVLPTGYAVYDTSNAQHEAYSIPTREAAERIAKIYMEARS